MGPEQERSKRTAEANGDKRPAQASRIPKEAVNGTVSKSKPSDSPPAKRKRADEGQVRKPPSGSRVPPSADERAKKRKLEDGSPSTKSRIPPGTSSRPGVQPSPKAIEQPREATPPPPSPPRKLKRPNRGILSQAERDALQRRREEREQRQKQEQAEHGPSRAGVNDFVKQHYNAVPERDRTWRKTDSKIKGLRAFNNWVKSTLIRKFTPNQRGVAVLDMGCGKGGDLQKWKSQRISHYVGLDVADVSIGQAWERYHQMARRGGVFKASFHVFDCFGKSIGEVRQVADVGFDAHLDPRWTNGGFDVVSMMFCMHYAFESEEKARTMLSNVVGALKKGGTFIGVIPNSDVLAQHIQEHYAKKQPADAADAVEDDDDDDWDPEKSVEEQEKEKKGAKYAHPDGQETDEIIEWGNDIYHVKFPGHPPRDGVFRPPYGWKYFYFLEEAVEEVPEYVVPWGVFRGLAEDFNLTLNYMEPFNEVWESERYDREGGILAERMGVMQDGHQTVTPQEMDAANFYIAFAFTKL